MSLRRHGGSVLWLLPLFVLITLAVLWTMLTIWLASERRQALQSQARIRANLLRALDEHMTSTLREVDQTTLFIKERYEASPATLDLLDLLGRGVVINPYYTQIGIIGPDGQLRMTDRVPFKPVDLRDREHFRVHAEHPDIGLYISKPVLGRSSGRWSIQFTRRLGNSRGDFLGVVVVSVDPVYFTNLYHDLTEAPHDGIMLVGRDGIVRAQQSATSGWRLGSDLNHEVWFRTLVSTQSDISTTSVTEPNGDVLTYTVRPIEGSDMLVVMRTAEVDGLQDYLTRRDVYLLTAALISLLLVAAGGYITLLAHRLQASQARAESANRLKSDFLARASHDLRTPLNGIIGSAELLHDTALDPTTRELSAMVLDGGRKLDRLVARILEITQLEAGMLPPQRQWFQPETLLREIVGAHQAQADGKHLALRLQMGELPVIFQDPEQLREICNNLLHNALIYTMAGEVTVSASAQGDRLLIAVQDTGPGLSELHRQAIFEPFTQIEDFLTRAHRGGGLGLAVTQQLVRLAGGELQLASTVGTGSTFTVSLPIRGA